MTSLLEARCIGLWGLCEMKHSITNELD